MNAPTPTPTPGPELRDIHLPPDPSWWPPAPGWWILALLVLVLGFFVVRWTLRRVRDARWRRRVHAELDRIAATQAAQPDPVQAAADVSRLLRRASLLIEPQAAALRDEAWLAFLDERFADSKRPSTAFREGAGRLLVDAPYRRAADPALQALDIRALLDLSRAWLRAALPRRRHRV